MEQNYKQFKRVTDRLITYLRLRDNAGRPGEDEVWEKIEKDLVLKKRFPLRRLVYICSAASVAVLVFFFLYSEFNQSDYSDSLDKYVAILENPVMDDPRIQVYLSAQDKITVEDSKASVAYSSQGKVLINEKIQESDSLKAVEQEYNQIIVPKGKYTHLTLSDGSTVHINSGTRVVYPRVFSGNCREIYVEGEVCLDVVKNEKTPFVVKTSQFNVEVLGTVFNVNAYKEDVKGEVVLVNGSVCLSDKHRQKIELKPNQLVAVEDGHIGKIKSVDASDYIAWTRGTLILNLTPLSEVFKKLERFYGQNIIVAEEAGTLRMKGKVDLQQSLDDLIVLISATAPITYEKREGTYYINKRE